MNNERNEKFDEMLDEISESYKIGDLTFSASDILYNCDPIAYRCAVSDWDSELESEDAE